MRRWKLIVVFLAMVIARPGASQTRAPGDLDPLGRVLVKVRVRLTESDGSTRAVTGLRLVAIRSNGDTVAMATDDAGLATAWLDSAMYQIVSIDSVTWKGQTYAWDLSLAVVPGGGALTLTETNSVSTTTVAVRPAEPPVPLATPGTDKTRLRLFVDCQMKAGCDLDYFRTEIQFVDHMRDRADAALHLLVTSVATGGGGQKYTLTFIGRGELSGMSDTVQFDSPQASTPDEIRNGLKRSIELGLVRYMVRTGSAARLSVTFNPVTVGAARTTEIAKDSWNLWVFRTTANGSFESEESQSHYSLRGTTSANRTSEMWKFNLRFFGGYDRSHYTFSDGSNYNYYTHYYGANQVLVRSIGSHWAAGEKASATSSTFLNEKLVLSFAPTIEFDFFPYSEATRRRFTVAYSAGMTSYKYEDTTLFDKIAEVRPMHSVTTSLELKQPWGSASLSLEGAALIDDFSKHHATLYNQLDLRLFKGFSLNAYSGLSLLRDQIYLAKGRLTDEEILLRRRQLASKYSYYGGIGLSYTFGSIFNNVVNPRFDGLK
ncbi:MAG: hypothetical protein ABIQ55_12545 [Gemmatimonadaceae bacterium]